MCFPLTGRIYLGLIRVVFPIIHHAYEQVQMHISYLLPGSSYHVPAELQWFAASAFLCLGQMQNYTHHFALFHGRLSLTLWAGLSSQIKACPGMVAAA